MLEKWLSNVLKHYADKILHLDADIAQVWGHLRVPNHENALDKQIARRHWFTTLLCSIHSSNTWIHGSEGDGRHAEHSKLARFSGAFALRRSLRGQ
jgi:hypothetical protein